MKKLNLKNIIPAQIGTAIVLNPDNAAVKFNINEKSSVWKGLLLQLRDKWIQNKQINGFGWERDFYIGRARILFGGIVNKYIDFFVKTDNQNMSRKYNNNSITYIQNA